MDKIRKPKVIWPFYLFLLPFLLIGLNSAKTVINILSESSEADNWQQAEAIILSVRLASERGGDSTFYSAAGHYIYQWQGKNYNSKRIFVSDRYDKDEAYHRDIVQQLKQHRRNKERITIWVNPDNPSDAVIYRDLRSSSIVAPAITALILLSISALIFGGIHYLKIIQKNEDEQQRRYPNEPWKWKKIWQTDQLKSSHKIQLIVLIIATIVMTIISVAAAPTIIEKYIKEQDQLILLFALFPFCTLICWVQTIIYFLRWKRFSDTRFKLDTLPAALGHILRGELIMKEKLPASTVFNIKLTNIRSHIVKSGNKSNRTETILWQDEQKIPVEVGSYSTAFRLPILFEIPRDAAPSNWEKSDNELLWRLNIQANIPGADYIQTFEIPVFNPSKYNINTQSVADKIHTRKTYTDQGDWSQTGVIANTTTTGQSYYFPPSRHKGVAFSMTAIAALCYVGAIGVPTWIAGDGIIESIGSIMFAVVGGIFALVFTLISLDAWLFRSTLDTSRDQLRVRSGMFKMRDRTYQVKQIKQLKLKRTTRVGNALYYDINAILHSGSPIKLAVSLVGKRDVTALMDKISQELGLAQSAEL